MKVTVVTASFNQGPFIKRCIDSILAQVGDFSIEHIVLDNCSTDETSEILKNYERSPGAIELDLTVAQDDGQTSAIIDGFQRSSGDIVCWLNTDEWYEKGAIQKVVEYFHAHPEVDVLFGDCNFVDVAGHLVKKKQEFFFSESMLLFYGCFIPSCSTFVRRRILDAGIFPNREFRIVMDADWYIRISKAGFRFAHMRRSLANFTWHETNISKSFPERKEIERWLILDQFGGIDGPKWFRRIVYYLIGKYWTFVRVLRRGIGSLS